MLDLDKEDTFTETHPDTGVELTLRPLPPGDYERLQKRAGKGKNNDSDPIKFAGLFAQHAIVDWGKVKQDCNADNKKKFGERFAYTIIPWALSQCMDAARSLDAEIDDAKND